MAKGKSTKGQPTIYKTLHRKLESYHYKNKIITSKNKVLVNHKADIII
jgi:hypothetical protein